MKQVYNVNIENEYPLPTPSEILSELPLDSALAENVFSARRRIEQIICRKDKRILCICGPCSIDSLPAAVEYAQKLKTIQERVSDKMFVLMRAYFEKPRTTVGWKGLVYDPDLDRSFNIEKGLRLSRQVLLELTKLNIPVATEILEPIIPQYIADMIAWASIGARTSESQTHRQLASGLSMPVGFKNSTDGSIEIAIDAIKTASARHSFLGVIADGRTGVFNTRGNPYCHVILRGGVHAPNYTSEYIAYTKELMRRRGLTPSIVIDCSHSNSQRNPEKQAVILNDLIGQINDGQDAIAGVMLESYLKSGRQEIADPVHRVSGLSITDPCMGWEQTEEALLKAYSDLKLN